MIVQNKAIRADPSPHIGEHSIEVQIPFLQRVKPNAKIVPVMMYEQNEQNCKILGDAIANVAKDKDVLILASSDLYHGDSYEECVKTDKRTLSYIKKMDPDGLLRALATSEAQACGGGPTSHSCLHVANWAQRVQNCSDIPTLLMWQEARADMWLATLLSVSTNQNRKQCIMGEHPKGCLKRKKKN